MFSCGRGNRPSFHEAFAVGFRGDYARPEFGFGGSYNLFGRIEGEIDHTAQALDVAEGRLFTAHLTQGQVVYHLGLRTFLRAILQYTDIGRDFHEDRLRVGQMN